MRTDSALSRRASIAAATGSSSSPPVEVEEEEVAAQFGAQRARLDPREVDPAGGELGQRVDQGAGLVVAQLGEDQRGLPLLVAPPAGSVPSGASQTKRVTLFSSSWIPSRRISQP